MTPAELDTVRKLVEALCKIGAWDHRGYSVSETWDGDHHEGAYIALVNEGRALLAAPQAAPADGWVMVPREPTSDMELAADRAELKHRAEDRRRGGHDPEISFYWVYRVMIEAAPPMPERNEK